MHRRSALALPLLAAAAPLHAQEGPPRRLGLLAEAGAEQLAAFERRLLEPLQPLGWRIGENLLLERGYAGGGQDRVAEQAATLLRRGVDVLVTTGTETTITAARATQRVPIVFVGVHYPLESGLVASYARPGGNVTGPALFPGIDISVKRLQMLGRIAPHARRASWIWPPWLFDVPTLAGGTHDMREPLQAGARAIGIELRLHAAPDGQPLAQLFDELRAARPQLISAAVPGPAGPLTAHAREQRWPSGFPLRYWAAAGGLLSYGPVASEAATTPQRAAGYIDRILRGARPADLPVQLPSAYELVLNARTARAIGAMLPRELLVQADEVID